MMERPSSPKLSCAAIAVGQSWSCPNCGGPVRSWLGKTIWRLDITKRVRDVLWGGQWLGGLWRARWQTWADDAQRRLV